MCLAAFAFGVSDEYSMVFAANRDELHARATAPADWWEDLPHVLGGRDLVAGGTWLAVDHDGRLAAVTNVPTTRGRTFEKSRGRLVADYLAGEQPADVFLARLATTCDGYGPYNLLIFDGRDFHYASNESAPGRLSPGAYAISNAPLGTPWPKVRFAESALADALIDRDPRSRLFELLEDRRLHGDASRDDGRQARVFIQDEQFGTRSSTVILISTDGEVHFFERRHRPDGTRDGESEHRFRLPPANALEATR